MAGDDDGERILAERLADGAGCAGLAEVRGDGAIRERCARWDGARDFVDAAVEGRQRLAMRRSIRSARSALVNLSASASTVATVGDKASPG